MVNDQLRVDFSTSRGHEMIIDRESGILRDELDEVEVQMLQAQRIPKLLPIDWVDIDGRVTFRYALSGRRMLVHRLQTQPLSMIEFYSMLLSIAEALDDSQHYMLRAEGFMLYDQYLFVGESWTDIGLVYVPLRGIKSAASPGEAVLTMAVRWLGYVDQPDGLGFQRILQHLRGEHVSWCSLRQTIVSLLGAVHSASLEPVKVKSVTAPVDEAAFQPFRQHEIMNKDLPGPNNLSIPAASDKWNAEEELPFNRIDTDKEDQNRSKKGWVLGTGFVIAIALIWRFIYLASPGRTSLLISGGLTLVAAAGLLFYWRRKNGDEDEADTVESWNKGSKWSEHEEGFVLDSTPLNHKSVSPNRPKQNALSGDIREREHKHESGSNNRFSFIENAEYRTVTSERKVTAQLSRASSNDATVLLGHKSNTENGSYSPAYWLERDAEGLKEQITLQAESFVIGRSGEGVHYVDRSSGISRAHLELSGNQGIWSAKDAGSRNGSTWNGQMMIPYKAYPLSNGDCIQLAGEKGPKYIYRTL